MSPSATNLVSYYLRTSILISGYDKIVGMPVPLFEHKPQHCPFGHPLWPGQARVGWKPCICTPAQEGAERGRGLGHLLVTCQACHAQRRDATFYEPPHDIRCQQAGPWLC